MHGGDIYTSPSHAINVPRKIHRTKVVSTYEVEASYPDIDEGIIPIEKQCLDPDIGIVHHALM